MDRVGGKNLEFEFITVVGREIALIAPPAVLRELNASNRQRYAGHPASLDHRRCGSIHWAAVTHGDKSESPAARNVSFSASASKSPLLFSRQKLVRRSCII